MRILVVRAGALGDTLMATPALRALKNRYPDSEIDFLCPAGARPLLEENSAISKLFTLTQRNVPYFLSLDKHRLVHALRERHYDIAGSARKRTRISRDCGARRSAREIRDIRATFDPRLHSIVDNLRAAGCGDVAPPAMELHLAPRDEMRAMEMLANVPRPRIGLHAGYGPPSVARTSASRASD